MPCLWFSPSQNSPESWQEQGNPHTIICRAHRAYPASQPSFLGTGQLLPARLLILAALLCLPWTAFPFPGHCSHHGLCPSGWSCLKSPGSQDIPPGDPSFPEHQPQVAEPVHKH